MMAVHNGEPFVGKSVQSILGQTFTDFELLVIDDGSTDGSRRIIRSIADSRIRLILNGENRGLTPSLNRGLAEATGEFVARIDADDIALPQRLARQVTYLDKHPDITLVGSGYREIDVSGHPGSKHHPPSKHFQLLWSLIFHCPFLHSSTLWRRDPVAKEVGLYSPSFNYAMDWDYWSRIGARLRMASIPDVLVEYRIGPQSMTATHPRVEAETAAARRVSMVAFFGETRTSDWIGDDGKLFSIIDGWDSESTEDDILSVLRIISDIHRAFVDETGLVGEERIKIQNWINQWTAQRLLHWAQRAHRTHGHQFGRTLFREAWRVHPRILATPTLGKHLLSSVAGSLLRARRSQWGIH